MAAPKFFSWILGIRTLVDSINTTAGVTDADKIIATGPDGLIDPSFLPLSGGSTPIDITHSDLLTIKGNSTLVKGAYYHITDKNIWIRAVEINQLEGTGFLLSKLPDFQNYSSNFSGIWNAGAQYSQVLVAGATVSLNGIMYESLTGLNGTSPDTDAVNWLPLDFSDTRYATEIDPIGYYFNVDWIHTWQDRRGNIIKYSYEYANTNHGLTGTTMTTFCRGNDRVYSNIIEDSDVDNINFIGTFSENKITQYCVVNVSSLNLNVVFQANVISQGSTITDMSLANGSDFSSNTITLNSSVQSCSMDSTQFNNNIISGTSYLINSTITGTTFTLNNITDEAQLDTINLDASTFTKNNFSQCTANTFTITIGGIFLLNEVNGNSSIQDIIISGGRFQGNKIENNGSVNTLDIGAGSSINNNIVENTSILSTITIVGGATIIDNEIIDHSWIINLDLQAGAQIRSNKLKQFAVFTNSFLFSNAFVDKNNIETTSFDGWQMGTGSHFRNNNVRKSFLQNIVISNGVNFDDNILWHVTGIDSTNVTSTMSNNIFVSQNGIINMGQGQTCVGAANKAKGLFSLATGEATEATGRDSIAGGLNSKAIADTSFAFGTRSFATRNGEFVYAKSPNGNNVPGSSQASFVVGGKGTTDNSIQEIKFGTLTSQKIIIFKDSAVSFQMIVSAMQYGGSAGTIGDMKNWIVTGFITNIGGVTTLGPFTITSTEASAGAAAWSFALIPVSSTTFDSIYTEVTGETNKTISWTVDAKLVQHTFGTYDGITIN